MPKPFWWDMLKLSESGWSSEYKSVDRLLKHLGRKSRSQSSRNSYCYTIAKFLLVAMRNDREVQEINSLLSQLANIHETPSCAKVSAKNNILSKLTPKLTPDELIKLAIEKPIEASELVQNFGDDYNDSGSTKYANCVIRMFVTYFRVNKTELELVGYSQPARSRKRPEYIPTLLEALKMADMTTCLRDRLAILLLTYTGLRNSTLRAISYDEEYPNDPFLQQYTIKKELERNEENVILIIHECMKNHVPNACKNRIFYYVFLPPKVTECLRLYIREMERKAQNRALVGLIFATRYNNLSLNKRFETPIGITTLEKIVKDAAERAGLEHWKNVYPHCLRKTYESFMRNQPDELKLDDKEREFLFGHLLGGSQDTYFDKTKIEEMRTKFARLNFEPSVSFEKEERVIPEEELSTYLKNEWHFVAALSSGKVVVFRKALRKKAECNGTKKQKAKNPKQPKDEDKQDKLKKGKEGERDAKEPPS